MNQRLDLLQPYPFARLRALLSGTEGNPDLSPLRLSIGEPKHEAPTCALQALQANLEGLSKYPATGGTDELKSAIANWLANRFSLNHVNAATQVLPVNGTREALFAVTQALVGENTAVGEQSIVLMPNPFYQIYEGAALLCGAEPIFFGLDPETNQPDFASISDQDWRKCQLMYICTPGNPTGQSIPAEQMQWLIRQAQKYDFVLVSDECYSELYLNDDQPCTGLLEACEHMGQDDYKNCLIFHSLSKRSNLPGLRSGFVAGDAELIAKFLLYRTYHGSAMPLHHQAASAAAWADETHVSENRELYRAKYAAVTPILREHFDFVEPDSGFYLWLETPIDDQIFARELFEQQHLTVVPGSFLARDTETETDAKTGSNPGKNRIRLALVSSIEDCVEAASRLCDYAKQISAQGTSTGTGI